MSIITGRRLNYFYQKLQEYFAGKRVITDGDFNNMKDPGFYAMQSVKANAPEGVNNSAYSLLVLESVPQEGGHQAHQIAIRGGINNHHMFIRSLVGGTWGDWKRIYVEGKISSSKTKKELADIIYPIGSIYMSINATNPATLFGGTWVRWGNGRVPVGIDTSQTEFNEAEKTGGSKNLQSHKHATADSNYGFTTYKSGGSIARLGVQTASSGTKITFTADMGTKDIDYSKETASAGTGNSENLQPYITCYMWKRTA